MESWSPAYPATFFRSASDVNKKNRYGLQSRRSPSPDLQTGSSSTTVSEGLDLLQSRPQGGPVYPCLRRLDLSDTPPLPSVHLKPYEGDTVDVLSLEVFPTVTPSTVTTGDLPTHREGQDDWSTHPDADRPFRYPPTPVTRVSGGPSKTRSGKGAPQDARRNQRTERRVSGRYGEDPRSWDGVFSRQSGSSDPLDPTGDTRPNPLGYLRRLCLSRPE